MTDVSISARTTIDIVATAKDLMSRGIQVSSVFGFANPLNLRAYGGRNATKVELNDRTLKELYSLGIGYRIPLTNKLIDLDMLHEADAFLNKYHRVGNSIILATANEDVIKEIRLKYPKYELEASVIVSPRSLDEATFLLSLFDTIVISGEFVNTDWFNDVPKDRIRLFLSQGCGVSCPHKMCYDYISEVNTFGASDLSSCPHDTSLFEHNPSNTMKIYSEELELSGITKWKMMFPEAYKG